jgi:nitrate reductase NapD
VSEELHVSSLLVQVKPASLCAVRQEIVALAGAEIFAESEAGKLVVVIESEAEGVIADRLSTISAMSGVFSASLIYHEISRDHGTAGQRTSMGSRPGSGGLS